MEAQTISFSSSLSVSLFWSLFTGGARAPSLSFLSSTSRYLPSLYLSLPYSPSSFFSGWLPLSLPSYRSPSVPSKNYALSEVNIRFTRKQNASARIHMSARLLLLFLFSFPSMFRARTHSSAYTCFCIYAWANCSQRPVIEDFGREWECHVDEWN